MESVTDANSHMTSFQYRYGVVNRVETPMATTTMGINPDGTTASVTNRGLTTSFLYDDLMRRTARLRPLVTRRTSVTRATGDRSP